MGWDEGVSGVGEVPEGWCVLQAACDVFCVGDDVNIEKANNSLISNDRSWKRSKFRLTYVAEAPELTQGTDRLLWRALAGGHMEETQGQRGQTLVFVYVKFPEFQPCLSPRAMPQEQPVTVPGPSGQSLSVSVTEMFGHDLLSLLLTPFFEARSWKLGLFPSLFCPVPLSRALRSEGRCSPRTPGPSARLPQLFPNLPKISCQPGGTGSDRSLWAVRGHSPESQGVLLEPSSVTENTCLGHPGVCNPLGLQEGGQAPVVSSALKG